MQYKIISFKTIKSHPFQSLLPADYIGPTAYIKELLVRFSQHDRIRLDWMLKNGVLAPERLRACAEEMQTAILTAPMEAVRKIDQKLADMLGGGAPGD